MDDDDDGDDEVEGSVRIPLDYDSGCNLSTLVKVPRISMGIPQNPPADFQLKYTHI